MSRHNRHALQVAVAALCAAVVYRLLDINHGYWVLLTAVFVLQATLGASLHRAQLRLSGTLSGVVLGALFCVLLPQHPWLFYGAAFVSLFLAVYLFRFSYAACMLCASFLVIILLAYHSQDAWQFAMARLLDTLIGVIIAAAVSLWVFPRAASHLHYRSIITSLQACQEYFSVIVASYFSPDYDRDLLEQKQEQLEDSLQESQQHYVDLHYEPSALFNRRYITGSMLLLQERLQGDLLSMRISSYDTAVALLDIKTREKFCLMANSISELFQQLVAAAKQQQALPSLVNLREANESLSQALKDWKQSNGGQIETTEQGLNLLLFLSSMQQLAGKLAYLHQALNQLEKLSD